jgi:hypothetical protein
MKDLDWLFELLGMMLAKFGLKMNFEHELWLYGLAASGLALWAFARWRQKKARDEEDKTPPDGA